MSNAKIGLLAGGAIALVAMAGTGGFYAGQLSAKVQFLEGQQLAQAAPVQPQQLPYGAAPAMDPLPTMQAPALAPVQSALNADGVPNSLVPVLSDAESAAGILDALSQASAIVAEGEVSHEQPIYAFFDPRCPFCHKAMDELNGRAAVKWIPVSLLGDLQSAADTIEGMKTLESGAAVASVVDGDVPEATGSTETQGQMRDNAATLLALYEGAQGEVAVPTILVPRADGTVTFYRGFDDGDGAEIVEAYGS